MIAAEDLLKPISEEAPCGEDLSYDSGLSELETMVRGKPETQFSPAEPPDWKQLYKKCLELWGRSKDLRIALNLSAALLQLEGLAGFRESLLLFKGLLERYWATVHPQLDPSDDNDPLQRVNIIASLATPIATYGDPVRIIEHLRSTPICNSVQMGRYSLVDILRAEPGAAGAADKSMATMPQIEAAFRDSNPEELAKTNSYLADSIILVREIDELLTQTVGATNAADLTPLSTELISIQRRVEPYVAKAAANNESFADQGGQAVAGAGPAISGEIRSREDVVKVLHKICDFYARAEPSSPVPLIIKRALRLAAMDFMQIMKDLSPDAIAQVRTITGEPEPEE